MLIQNILFVFIALVIGIGIDLIVLYLIEKYAYKPIDEGEFYVIGLSCILLVICIFDCIGYIQF